jgi:hypothetical protein
MDKKTLLVLAVAVPTISGSQSPAGWRGQPDLLYRGRSLQTKAGGRRALGSVADHHANLRGVRAGRAAPLR